MDIIRHLDLADLLRRKSYLLLGPRQTGKSRLIAAQFPGARIYNLLNSDIFRRYFSHPEMLRQDLLLMKNQLVIIDEIQRVPELLNEVHTLIEENNLRFLLTGSSARKLSRQRNINLLGGRLRKRFLNPFSMVELKEQYNLEKASTFGLLPSIWFSDSPTEDLNAYLDSYLQHEIALEASVRNVPAFARFLEVAAVSSGKIINYTNIANDSQIPRTTIYEYFAILKETLIGIEIPAYLMKVTRKPITRSKFYFFDIGMVNRLLRRGPIGIRTSEFGECFEHLVLHELKCHRDYSCQDAIIEHWRSTSNFEVDFIWNREIAIEVKAKSVVIDNDLKGLRALKEDRKLKKYLVVCLESNPRKTADGIDIVPFNAFLNFLL